MYKLPYFLIKQLITTLVPEIKLFEWYIQQDSPQYKGGITQCPAVYITFLPTTIHSLQNGLQEATLEFELLLITDNLKGDDQRIDDLTGLAHLDLVNKIHANISGKTGKVSEIAGYESLVNTANDYTVLNTIDRTYLSTQHINSAFMKTTQRFKSYSKDPSGSIKFQAATANLVIESLEVKS